ncbi:MAG: GIY-YIG nuclease family protein [Spirochaetota bacterium]
MAYIYQIINKINKKSYIGQTNFTLEQRFKEHINDSRKDFQNRPLYSAFKKYGIKNFEIVLIEETDQPNEREMYYIEKNRTYVGFEDSNGYNATLGGEGRRMIDIKDKEIIDKYQELKFVNRTADFFNLNPETVSKILKANNIEVKTYMTEGQFAKKTVYFKDKVGNKKEFESVIAAANWLVENNLTQASVNSARVSIGRAISGIRKSYLGLTWFKNE